VYLGALGGAHSGALGINDHGQVVGLSWLVNGHHHAFLFDGESLRDLGTLRCRDADCFDTTSEAYDINNAGTVIGESRSLGAQPRQFVWNRERGMCDLSTLIVQNPTGSQNFQLERVSDINNRGQIVGWGYFGHDQAPHAALLEPITFPQALHTFFTK
jgi:probable HAF family extracellular repeat protein